MADTTGPFTINRDDVAAKVIDGELILIRLSDGTYYSMENVGTRVWELIEAGHDLPTTARTLAAWFGRPIERVAADVQAVVDELLAEGLIAPTGAAAAPAAAPAPPGEGLAYEPPRLNIYRDMGNLLALDPPTPGIDDLSSGNDPET